MLTYTLFVSITMLALDACWLFFMVPRLYLPRLTHLLAPHPQWWAALIFYIIYAFGISFFIVDPALKDRLPLKSVFFRGALLGVLAYATYDLTNQALLKDWPILITLIDIAWGSFLTGTTASLSVFLIGIWQRR